MSTEQATNLAISLAVLIGGLWLLFLVIRGTLRICRRIANRVRGRSPSSPRAQEPDDDFVQIGLYQPHFEFTDSDQFKQVIGENNERQKALVKQKKAVRANTDWQVAGDRREGQRMAERAIKLTLRAFNSECDSAVANARWNNIDAMEKRIVSSYDQINKLNETMKITITGQYLRAKTEQLRLTHEYREKQKDERDHSADLRRQKREEQKLTRDAEHAEKEQFKYQKLLDQAQREASGASEDKTQSYQDTIAELTLQLATAQAASERAKSMAEQTRAGYVYVISNIGSFGEGVYKVGMTRRLDPMDRVKELGDASVPFVFDVHAMVYTEDAPGLEKTLHRILDAHRVNRVNNRKEFFEAPLATIMAELRQHVPEADVISEVEAQEYRQTLLLGNTEAANDTTTWARTA